MAEEADFINIRLREGRGELIHLMGTTPIAFYIIRKVVAFSEGVGGMGACLCLPQGLGKRGGDKGDKKLGKGKKRDIFKHFHNLEGVQNHPSQYFTSEYAHEGEYDTKGLGQR